MRIENSRNHGTLGAFCQLLNRAGLYGPGARVSGKQEDYKALPGAWQGEPGRQALPETA